MAKKKTIRTIPQERAPIREQVPAERIKNFAEVAHGFRIEDALHEAERCLLCPDPACIAGCPVGIDIPGFIVKISAKDFRGAYDVISDTNLLPAVCGRVCPQETQCEGVCPVGETLEPVAIGRLERFVGDQAIQEGWTSIPYIEPKGFKVGIVAPGPRAWPVLQTWRRRAAKSRSTRPSICPEACCATASPISGCPTK